MALPMAAPAAASFMSTWGPSILSAGSSLLGGLFGGKEKKGPSPQEQVNAQVLLEQTMSRNRPSWLVEGAKAAGINPMLALGMNPYQGGISFATGDTKPNAMDALSQAGQDLSRSIAAKGTGPERAAAAQLSELTLEKASLENDLLRTQIRNMNGQLPPSAPIPGASYEQIFDQDARYPSQRMMPMGYGDTAPFWRQGKDANGDPIRVYNDELGDNEFLQAVTLPVSLHDIARNAGQRVGKWMREPRFKKSWWTGHGYGTK